MRERGQIRNAAMREQINDFASMRWNKITPTDIDGAIDFGGKFFVFFDIKSDGAPFSRGQELFFENLCRALRVPSVFALAVHGVTPPDEVIGGDCVVRRYYWRERGGVWTWVVAPEGVSLLRFVNEFLRVYGLREKYQWEPPNVGQG